MVECGTCNPKIESRSLQIANFCLLQKLWSLQCRVRQLALRASLETVGDSDHERVAWLLYKGEVPPVCIPRATGDKGVKQISLHTLGILDHATICQEEVVFLPRGFSPVSPSISLGSFIFHLLDQQGFH